MKKSLIISMVSLYLVSLTSCINGRPRNYFIAGEFSGINTTLKGHENETYYLSVIEITKDDYKLANGINVLKDVVKKKYYELVLYYVTSDLVDTKNYITLSKLENRAIRPVFYIDEFKNIITPYPGFYSDGKYGRAYNMNISKESAKNEWGAFVDFREVKND